MPENNNHFGHITDHQELMYRIKIAALIEQGAPVAAERLSIELEHYLEAREELQRNLEESSDRWSIASTRQIIVPANARLDISDEEPAGQVIHEERSSLRDYVINWAAMDDDIFGTPEDNFWATGVTMKPIAEMRKKVSVKQSFNEADIKFFGSITDLEIEIRNITRSSWHHSTPNLFQPFDSMHLSPYGHEDTRPASKLSKRFTYSMRYSKPPKQDTEKWIFEIAKYKILIKYTTDSRGFMICRNKIREARQHLKMPGDQKIIFKAQSLDNPALIIEATSYTMARPAYQPLGKYMWFKKRILEKIRQGRKNLRQPTVTPRTFNGRMYKVIGGVFEKPNTIMDLSVENIMDNIWESKKPLTDEPHMGVELEFCVSADQTSVAKAIVKAGLLPYCQLKEDSSIEPDNSDVEYDEYGNVADGYDYEQGMELTVCVPESKAIEVLEKVTTILKNSFRAYTNLSCGMHVHIDCRNRPVARVFNNFVLLQDTLFKLVDEDRRDNTYCERVTTNVFEEEDEDHYHAINGANAYNKYGTVEIRIHEGTLDFAKIKNWLKMLQYIANHESMLDEDISQNKALKEIGVDEEVLSYYKLSLVGATAKQIEMATVTNG